MQAKGKQLPMASYLKILHKSSQSLASNISLKTRIHGELREFDHRLRLFELEQ
jgi:hypothetical protein